MVRWFYVRAHTLQGFTRRGEIEAKRSRIVLLDLSYARVSDGAGASAASSHQECTNQLIKLILIERNPLSLKGIKHHLAGSVPAAVVLPHLEDGVLAVLVIVHHAEVLMVHSLPQPDI